MRNLHLLGRKLLKRKHIVSHKDRPNSQEQSMLSPPKSTIEYRCPIEPNINLYCRECEDLQDYEVIETIENGNLVHRYKCLKCGVILAQGR